MEWRNILCLQRAFSYMHYFTPNAPPANVGAGPGLGCLSPDVEFLFCLDLDSVNATCHWMNLFLFLSFVSANFCEL